ncbi:hypothetical protein EHQ05_06225 [Leptospira yasudae]|nr:hypothetical protein EHQ05_06225 [Leptospira yasudae]TGM04568.1 hypothetical protein EHQ86_12510 [Leptospira yasudae]
MRIDFATDLFESVKIGNVPLQNKIVMAPLPSLRAIDNVPNSLMVTYYSPLADTGPIVTEANSPSDRFVR